MAFWGQKNNQIGSTQEHLKFSEIRDQVVITKTSELRAILMVSSINFALKSEQEQNAIIFAYQNFLNSLNFPIQIVMQSKKLDLSKYLTKLQESANLQTNELLRVQTFDYIDFIKRLINVADIMDKKFYVVVPFMPAPQMTGASGLIKTGKDKNRPVITLDEFNSWKTEIDQRVEVTIAGLGSIGLRAVRLNTQQIIELLYGIYNPEEATKEKLTNYENLTSRLIQSEVEKPVSKTKE